MHGTFLCTVQKQKNWYVKIAKRGCHEKIKVKNQLEKTLASSLNFESNVKLNTNNHILVKGPSKYRRYKHCGGKSIYLCQKRNVALYPDCFKDYHL